MKKLLMLSLLISFQNNQGMEPFRSNGETSSNSGTHLKPTYTIITSDKEIFSNQTCVTNSSAQGIFSHSTPEINLSNQKDFSSSEYATSSSDQREFQTEFLNPNMISSSYQSEFLKPPRLSASSSQKKSSKPMYIITPSASGYFSSDEYIEPHSFTSGEKLKVPINFKRRNSTQVALSPEKSTDSTLFKKKLEFYDNLPKEAFHDSEINQNGWNEKPKDFYITILLGRHVGDKANMNKTAHTSSGHSEINLETVGIDKALSLMTLGYLFKFDAIAAGTSARHDTTARLISSFSPEKQEYKIMKEFNEQRLGHLGGKHEKDILQNPEFIRMFNDCNYKMKKNETEEDENCESGSEVISRFTNGIDKIIHSVNEYRENYVETHKTAFSSMESKQDFLSKNMLLYICTSRCTLNWMIRYFTGNMQLPLQLKTIQNCNLFCINYYPNSGKYDVLLNNEDMPLCISPMHFSHFALKSPVFSPFIQTFCQRVSRIIEKQEEKQDEKPQVLNQSNSEKLLRTVYLKMLSQSLSYHPEPKRKIRHRARSN